MKVQEKPCLIGCGLWVISKMHKVEIASPVSLLRRFVNINAVVCLTLSTFVYGFYA